MALPFLLIAIVNHQLNSPSLIEDRCNLQLTTYPDTIRLDTY